MLFLQDDISAIKTDFKAWPSVIAVLLFLFPSLNNFIDVKRPVHKTNSDFIITLLVLPCSKKLSLYCYLLSTPSITLR